MEHETTLTLWRQCATSDDDRIWGALVRRLEPRLKTYLRCQLAGEEATRLVLSIDDYLQEVYCRLLERSRWVLRHSQPATEAGLFAYLKRVCSSVVVDQGRHFRAVKRRSATLELLPRFLRPGLGCTPPTDQRLLVGEARRLLRSMCILQTASPRLGVRNFWLFEQAVLHGWKSRELAALVGLSPRTIDSVVARCRSGLRRSGWRFARRWGSRGPRGGRAGEVRRELRLG